MSRGKRICLSSKVSLDDINPDTITMFQRYKVDMTMRNLSEETQHQYETDLRQWFSYVYLYQQNRCVTDLCDDDITEFLYFCMKEGNNSQRIKRRIAVISTFYKFLRKKKLIKENPVEFVDRPKHGIRVVVQSFLTPEQVALMREKLIECGDIQLRTYAMLSLSTMARVRAVASIRWEQIDLHNKVIHNVLEKESKIVDLFFSEEVKLLLTQLRSYRISKNIDDRGWVFYSGRNKDKPINKGTLNAWCKRIGKMIDVPTLHPHDFRHSGATLLKNAGMSLEDVATLLSHENTDTTRKFYIKQDTARISAVKSLYNI